MNLKELSQINYEILYSIIFIYNGKKILNSNIV